MLAHASLNAFDLSKVLCNLDPKEYLLPPSFTDVVYFYSYEACLFWLLNSMRTMRFMMISQF